MRNENNAIKVPAKMCAMAVKHPVGTVDKVRAGKRVKGPVAKKIKKADEMLLEKITKAVAEVSAELEMEEGQKTPTEKTMC